MMRRMPELPARRLAACRPYVRTVRSPEGERDDPFYCHTTPNQAKDFKNNIDLCAIHSHVR